MIAIAAIGVTTSTGAPTPLPWPVPARSTCTHGWFARDVDPALRGPARWHALAQIALAECGARGPIVVASCNGGAAELDASSWASAFALGHGPIASAACASGLHALWLARGMIEDGDTDEVTVLAVDALSPAAHANFEILRVLAPDPAPWQPHATGFVPGEAAVAVRLVRAQPGDGLPRLVGPLLSHDLDEHDALAALAPLVTPPRVARIIGQGTGPALVDARELAALEHLPLAVPLSSPFARYGHTIGASGLLSVALATRDDAPSDDGTALDGRRLGRAAGDALIICRALGGACVAAGVTRADLATAPAPPSWVTSSVTPPGLPPLRIPLLRRIVAEALAHRPAQPPDALIVHLDSPLVPPDDARIGERLLPSVVLEMTPGFVAQLIARAWGYRGPAITQVGSVPAVATTCAGDRSDHRAISVVYVRGSHVHWHS
ncbi:MAG TPA: beta-ketoacyl synthase N-terminal-like domain-containing protein [Kofleriaceae bacterium]